MIPPFIKYLIYGVIIWFVIKTIWDLVNPNWEKRHETRKDIDEIQERYSMYSFYSLEFFEFEAERLLEYVKVEGNKYKIIRVEELINAISEMKEIQYKQWERSGNPSYLGNKFKYNLRDGSKPGSKLPFDNL